MKSPKPTIPKGAPEGTIWFGGPIEWFQITLRITGAELVPEEITQLLGCVPDFAQERGKPLLHPDGKVKRMPRQGSWRLILKPADTDEWDPGEAMLELLRRLPAEVSVWKSFSERFKIDFFVGLEMTSKNKGFSLSPQVMQILAERGIEAGFDVYYEG